MVENEDEIFGNRGTYPHLQSHRHASSDRIACPARVLPPKPSSPTPFPPHLGGMRLLPQAAFHSTGFESPLVVMGGVVTILPGGHVVGPKPSVAPGCSLAPMMSAPPSLPSPLHTPSPTRPIPTLGEP